MSTSITTELLAAFLNCRYKAFLKATNTPSTTSDFQQLETTLQQEFVQRARQHLLGSLPADQVSHAPKSLARALHREHSIITNAHAAIGDLSVCIDALVRPHSKSSCEYIPVRFVCKEKVVRQDKLLLAFWGLCLARMGNCDPRFGKIIYGEAFTPTKVRIDTLISSVEHSLLDIASFSKSNAAPQLRLNGHCSVCEFQQHCRDHALETDDLSLLRTIKDQEITKLNAKGIFTTTQLSYTYRPRRRRKKAKSLSQNTRRAER